LKATNFQKILLQNTLAPYHTRNALTPKFITPIAIIRYD